LDVQNIRYAVSAFSPWIDHKSIGSAIEINLKTEVNNLAIHYTLDGSEPTTKSELYKEPFKIKKSSPLKARAFKDGEPVGYLSEMYFPIHLAMNQNIVDENKKPLSKLTNLNYSRLHPSDTNWIKFENDFSATILFDTLTEVKEVSFNTLRFTILGIYPPKKVEIWGSEDGKGFTLLATKNQEKISLIQGRNKVNSKVTFEPAKIKALKIKTFSHRPLGEGHHRAGRNSVTAVDEIVVF
jgi:hexosaminidase